MNLKFTNKFVKNVKWNIPGQEKEKRRSRRGGVHVVKTLKSGSMRRLHFQDWTEEMALPQRRHEWLCCGCSKGRFAEVLGSHGYRGAGASSKFEAPLLFALIVKQKWTVAFREEVQWLGGTAYEVQGIGIWRPLGHTQCFWLRSSAWEFARGFDWRSKNRE